MRETLGSGEERPAERRPHTHDRQHETQADQRGKYAPTSVEGALMAARRSGVSGLTIGLDQTQTPSGIAGNGSAGFEEAGLELENGGHGSVLLR